MGPMPGLDGCGKSRPYRDSSPDCPARSKSLYRLSYRGPQCRHMGILIRDQVGIDIILKNLKYLCFCIV